MTDRHDVAPGSSPAAPIQKRTRGYLPHWERDGGAYFVTFRLADSLPESVLSEILERRSILERAKKSGCDLLPCERVAIEEVSSARIETLLDAGSGACYFRRPQLADLAATALMHHDGKRYQLISWCVMPNHVHLVLTLSAGQSLAAVVRSWKSFTGRKANEMLGRTGPFWQREYYDRLLRNEDEVERAIDYVVSNPVRAGLHSWRWVEGPPGWNPALRPSAAHLAWLQTTRSGV